MASVMPEHEERDVPSGIPPLDDVLRGIRLGDNVVWQVEDLPSYEMFARAFAKQSLLDGRRLVYMRFAPHAPVLGDDLGICQRTLDPAPGFDQFSRAVHRLIEAEGPRVMYVFDSLSHLAQEWATDEMLANFFQVTCPFLYQLDTVAYFALDRRQHDPSAVSRIRETTQILIDVFSVTKDLYVYPLKVAERYGPQMFLPHLAQGDHWPPVLHGGVAVAAAMRAGRHLLRRTGVGLAPWESIQQHLLPHRNLDNEALKANPELHVLKQEFVRMLLGEQGDLNRLADRYLTLGGLFDIRDRLIGSGRIGGKAAGMLVAHAILVADGGADVTAALEGHDSFFIGSDVFFTFIVQNDLFRRRLEASRQASLSPEEFAEIEQQFLSGRFPDELKEQFRNLLDYFGQAPIIVRSSSLLEDSVGNAFAGKYRSEFCTNQGSPEERMASFLRAVKLVYASALNPDALAYRRRRGLIERDEQMAILVQRVSGMHYKHYFFPSLAGVAFSRNLYAWTDRIDPTQGIIRLVFGLGTRAVDRVGGDYPRMIAVSHPGLRPEIGTRIITRYSQHSMDVLNLASRALETRPVGEVLEGLDYPGLSQYVSVRDEIGDLNDPVTPWIDAPSSALFLTFNNLIARTRFVALLGTMLRRIEAAYNHPVDTEFTASVRKDGAISISLLQCRPLWLPGTVGRVELPEDLPPDRVLFRADRMISGGVVCGLRYLLHIDPRAYATLDDPSRKRSIGRIVGRLNQLAEVQEGRMVMMGPGRWGSSNIDLGVNVGYGDINSAAVLVEIAREEHGHVPEVSYGTHFFQDIVESEILYFPVYPDDPSSAFNDRFLREAPNHLADMLPACADMADVVRVIDFDRIRPGLRLCAVADPETHRAVCYLDESVE